MGFTSIFSRTNETFRRTCVSTDVRWTSRDDFLALIHVTGTRVATKSCAEKPTTLHEM